MKRRSPRHYGGGPGFSNALHITAAILRRGLPDWYAYLLCDFIYNCPAVHDPVKADIIVGLMYECYDSFYALQDETTWMEPMTREHIEALVPVAEQRYQLWVQAGMNADRYAVPLDEKADDESDDEAKSENEHYAPDSPVASAPVSTAPVIEEIEEVPPAKRARYTAPVTSAPRPGSHGFTASFIRPAPKINLWDRVHFCPPEECLLIKGMIVGQPEWEEGRWMYRLEVKVPENTLATKAMLVTMLSSLRE